MEKRINETILELKIDPFTRLYNRSTFDASLAKSFAEYRDKGKNFILLVIDVDKFKNVNDTYGHAFGDEVLKMLAQTLTSNLRSEEDVAFRYGGEEFAVLISASDDSGEIVAEKLRSAFNETAVMFEGQELHFGISIGVCGAFKDAANAKEIFLKADEALYKAKTTGRNKVVSADVGS
jgi:diguanylate cyclase